MKTRTIRESKWITVYKQAASPTRAATTLYRGHNEQMAQEVAADSISQGITVQITSTATRTIEVTP